MIDQPITGERWTGVKDAGSWFNGQPARANAQVKPLAETIVLVTTPDQFTGAGAAAFERLGAPARGRLLRRRLLQLRADCPRAMSIWWLRWG